MNERIRELAEQAREKKFDYRAREGESHYIYVLNKEKFAELIVQECCDVVEKNLYQNIGWNTSRAVRHHFGLGPEE